MAVLAKKLRIKTSGGAQQAANIYSTPGEASNNAMRVSVDGVAGYVALGSTGDARRTNGRVKKSNGTTYAVLTDGTPAYAYRLLTANGSFTVPTGVTKLRVTCVGGGAGGHIHWCYRYADSDAGTFTSYGFAGGNTVFGSVTGAGASRSVSQFVRTCSGSGENVSCSVTLKVQTQSVGFRGGAGIHNWDGTSYPGQAAVPLTNYAGTQIATAGAGGYADGDGIYLVYPGAAGYRTVKTIAVTPGQKIAYTIGGRGMFSRNGNAQESNNSGGAGGAPGTNGAILVEWGKGIQ